MSFSIVIPSRSDANLRACLAALDRYEPDAQVIVVDDGLVCPVVGCIVIAGVKPFVFARNCNLGMRHCAPNDVVLLNDDAILKTDQGLTMLAAAALSHPEYGVIAAASTNVGNRNQERKTPDAFRDEPRMVCFSCVFIKRSTIERVGLLNEEFVGYGFEDDAYCLRVRRAGLKIAVFDGCFVDHGTVKSTFRGGRYPVEGFKQNEAIFRKLFGAGNHDL